MAEGATPPAPKQWGLNDTDQKDDPPYLVQCLNGELQPSDDQVVLSVTDATYCLWALAVDDNEHEGLVAAASIEAAVAANKDGKEGYNAQVCLLGFISCVCRNEDAKRVFMENGGVRCLNEGLTAGAAGLPPTGNLLTNALLASGTVAAGAEPEAATKVFNLVEPFLKRYLFDGKNAGVQRAALQAYTQMAAYPKLQHSLLELMSFSQLLEMPRKTGNQKVRNTIPRAIYNFLKTKDTHAQKEFTHECVKSPLVVPLLIEVLGAAFKPPGIELQIAYNLFMLAKDIKDKTVLRGCIPKIIPLLKSEEDEGKLAAAGVMWMCSLEQSMQSDIHNGGAIPMLVKLLSHKQYQIQFHAQGALRNLAWNANILEDILACRPPQHLVDVWKPIEVPTDSDDEDKFDPDDPKEKAKPLCFQKKNLRIQYN